MKELKLPPKRNSLLELYRFFFAVWVLYFHGYFLVPANQWFQDGYISVEFFFILTGFFLVKLYDRQRNKSFFKGLLDVGYKKVKPLGITLIITLILAFTHYAIFYRDFSFGYMWYIKWLVAVPLVYFIFYRITVSRPNWFYFLIFSCIFAFNILNHYFPDLIDPGFYRGSVAIGIGVLLSKIPKNKWKIGKLNINIIFTILFIAIISVLACFNYLYELNWLFIYILFPCLIYFSSCINFHCAIFDYLGGISFGIYGYQTVCRILEDSGVLNRFINTYIMTLIVFALAILDDLAKRIFRMVVKRKIENKEKLENENKADQI